jgi:hypothetical protein
MTPLFQSSFRSGVLKLLRGLQCFRDRAGREVIISSLRRSRQRTSMGWRAVCPRMSNPQMYRVAVRLAPELVPEMVIRVHEVQG